MALDQTLISIRERRQVDLFDLALVVCRRRAGPLGLAAVAGMAPFALLNAWLFHLAGTGGPALGLLLWWVEAPFAAAPLTLVLGGMMFGRTPTPWSVARQCAGAVGTLLATHGLLRFLPVFWAPPRLLFANEVILLEHAGWLKLWKRGGDLAGGRDGDLFFFSMLQTGATWCFAALAYLGVGRLVQAALAEELTWDLPGASLLTTATFQIPMWVAVAYFAVVRFLTYIDQRIRLEGWEIKLRLHAAGEAMTEGRRW